MKSIFNKIFTKAILYRVIRIGLLLLMVIVGLTAFAPEWLDLKDVLIAEHSQKSTNYGSNSKPFISQDSINSIEGFIYGINNTIKGMFSSINNIIVGTPRPKTIGVPGAILLLLLWYGLVIFMYLCFLSLNFVVFLFTKTFTKKHTSVLVISTNHPKVYLLVRLFLSFAISLIIWSFLIPLVWKLIMVIVK